MHRFQVWLFTILMIGMPTMVAHAQMAVSGQVVDASTGQSLYGASLQVEGTYTGTITNAEGSFSLNLATDSAVLIVRFIGFQSARVSVDRDSSSTISIRLEPSTIELGGVTITGEDPAIAIMRRVVEEKQRWREGLNTYSVEAYNRFRMENDTGIVSIWESGTKAYWDRERGVREVSVWQQQTRNMDFDGMLPAALFVMNLYDDDLEVAGYRLMGVTHPDALDHYRFSLESIEARDESEVYVISVRPKRGTFSGFDGTIRVLDGEYAMIAAELQPSEAFLFPPPIQYVQATYRQQFSSFGLDAWLPIDMQSDMAIKVGINGLLVFPEVRVRQMSRLSDFELNVVVPDSLYESDTIIAVDSTVSRPTVRPPDVSAVPLTEQELKAYETIDSTMTIEKAYEPSGALSRFVNTEDNSSGSSSSSSSNGPGGVSRRVGSLDVGFRPALWYNRVEGWHAGGRLRLGVKPWLSIDGTAAIETARGDWSRGAGIGIGKKARVRLEGFDQTALQVPSEIKSQLPNVARVMLGSPAYYDYYRRRGVSASLSFRRVTPLRLNISVGLSREDHASLDQELTESLLGRVMETSVNPGVAEGSLDYFRIVFQRSWDDFPLPIGPQQSVKLALEKGLGGDIAGGSDYHRVEASGFWRLPTFFKRRILPTVLDVRMVAGKAFGTVPPQRFGLVDGSRLLSVFGVLKTVDNPPYRGDEWLLLAWEHSFRTIPFEMMGFDGFVQRHWHLILHGAHGRTRLTEARSSVDVPVSGGWHHEAGVSLSGLFTVIRLDAAWRLDEPGFRIGISTARIF